jgi:hypothetical protein
MEKTLVGGFLQTNYLDIVDGLRLPAISRHMDESWIATL